MTYKLIGGLIVPPGDLPESTSSSQGVIKLTGDLSGTASSPTVVRIRGSVGSNHQVLLSDGVIPFWAQITDGYISSSANIDVSKLSAGSNGQVLETVGGVATWSTAGSTITLAGDVTGTVGANTVQAIRGSVGSNNQVLLSDGTIPFWGQIKDGYVASNAAIGYSKLALSNSIVNADVNSSAAIAGSKITSATTGALGVIQLATDLGGTATSPNVIRLTGSSNIITLPSTNVLTWDSSGPTIGARSGTPTDIALKVNTTNSSIALFDTTNIIGFFNWNSGSPYFQQFNGTGFQILSTGGDLILNASTTAKNVQFWTANTLRLTLSNSALTFATGVTTPAFTQADNITNSATATSLTVQAQNATGLTSNGGNLYLQSGTGTSADGYVALYTGNLHQRLTIQNTGVITIANLGTGIVHADSSGNLTSSSIVNADVNSSAAIAYSKLALSNSIVNADINSSAAIAYSKLTLSNSIVNADIASAAAIAVSKLANGSDGQVLQTVSTTPTWSTYAGDVTGSATASAVVQLTGSAGVVSVPSGNLLTWASSGPTFGARPGTVADAMIKVNTANSSIVLYDNSNIIGFFNYNSGSPYFQQYNGAGFQILATGGDLILNASTAAKNIQLWTANTLRLTLSNSALTFATGVTTPSFTQADNTTNSATAATLTIQAQNATGTTANGGGLTLTSGTGTTANGSVLIKTGGTTKITVGAAGGVIFADDVKGGTGIDLASFRALVLNQATSNIQFTETGHNTHTLQCNSVNVISLNDNAGGTGGLGFYTTTPQAKQTVTGALTDLTSAGALKHLLTALATIGLITDSSS